MERELTIDPKKSFYDKQNYEKKILINNIRKSKYIKEEEGYVMEKKSSKETYEFNL